MTDSARNAAESCRVFTTTFEHIRDPDPINERDWTWGEFVAFIERNGHQRCASKEQQSLFGLYKLKDGTTSKNVNVEIVTCWTLDLDKLSEAKVADVLGRLAEDGLAFLVYSTHSHTEARPKLRLTGPLLEPVKGKDWPPVWRAIVDKFSPGADEQCKDVRRLYYWPSCPEGTDPVLFHEAGAPLDVGTLDVKAAPVAAKPAVDLDAKDVLDGGYRVERAASGTSPFTHAERLCLEMPAAVDGQGGSIALLRVARALAWGLELEPAQAVDLIRERYNPRCAPPWTDAEIEHKVDDATNEAGAPYERGALCPPPPDSFDHLPIVVQNAGRYWLRDVNGDDYARRSTKDDLIVVVKKHYPSGTHDFWSDGDMPELTEITKYSQPVSTIVSCFYQKKTSYDPESEVLVEGLRIDERLVPKFDADVEALLVAYGGDQTDELKKWIAGCRADRLSAPSRALAIIGQPGLGKSLYAHALARCWGQPVVPAEVLCARFNGALKFCPIVLADEELPADLTGEAFRNVIQARTHSIEPKGKERHGLLGCIRMVVAANDLNKLHLAGGKGKDDVAAIAARFFVVNVPDERAPLCYAAQKPLLGEDGSTVDVARMAAHFLHIQNTVEPEKSRFIGTTSDGGALAFTLAAEAERAPELFDLLRDFFNAGGTWATSYRLAQTSGIVPQRGEIVPEARANFPIIVVDGKVFVRLPVLGQLVGRDLRNVTESLKPFTLGTRRVLPILSADLDVIELNVESLLASLDLDVDKTVETLMTDTADRLPNSPAR